MCIPEVIFFDDKSGDHHSRRRGNALRPLSADLEDSPPVFSSPPFVVQVSPKLGHHHHRPLIRYQRAEPRSELPPPRKREEMEWREGFRAGRQAVRTREGEEKKRNSTEMKKTVTVEDQPEAGVPDVITKLPQSQRTAASKPGPVEVITTINTSNADVSPQPVSARTEPAQKPPPVRKRHHAQPSPRSLSRQPQQKSIHHPFPSLQRYTPTIPILLNNNGKTKTTTISVPVARPHPPPIATPPPASAP